MAVTAAATVSATFSGLPEGGSRTVGPAVFSSSNASNQVQTPVLASGDNTITLPTNPTVRGCLIFLPAGNTLVVKLKSTGADAGLSIGKTGWFHMCWDDTPPATFVLNAAGLHSAPTTIIFY